MTIFKLAESPVVRFIAKPPDRNGYHSLVQDCFDRWDWEHGVHENAGWTAPMLCTVTLIEVTAAGEWEVHPHRPGLQSGRRGLRVMQPLFTVEISYG